MDNEVVKMKAEHRAYFQAHTEFAKGEIDEDGFYDRLEELKKQFQDMQFKQLMLDNGLAEEEFEKITPAIKRLLLAWSDEMDELQKRVDNYASWAEDCPY